MDALRFGRDRLSRPGDADRIEWLVTNGIGGYAGGTVSGALTRRHHGLLVAALEPPLGRTLLLAKLGLLGAVPACTDLTTKPWVQEAGVEVLNQPFFAKGNVATAGGCLSAPYLAAWLIARSEGIEAAKSALHYVAPVGEKEDYVARALRNIEPYLPSVPAATAAAA